MKYAALLMGLILAAPAMAQSDTKPSPRNDRPATDRAHKQRPQSQRGQDPVRKGQGSRGTDRRPGSNGGGISPGLLRRFDTNGDGKLSKAEKLAARRRIAQWRDRSRGNNDPRGGQRGDQRSNEPGRRESGNALR